VVESADDTVVRVRDLAVAFRTSRGLVHAVRDVSLDIRRRRTLCIVGESGSGKSVTLMSLLGLLPSHSARVDGRAWFDGLDLLHLSPVGLRTIRGSRISMIFQDGGSAMNPSATIGAQVAEGIRIHDRSRSRDEVDDMVRELLDAVGIPRGTVMGSYPHQLSGGMRQRVMIAMAIANRPEVLLADEPTTALDVTIQAQVLDLLRHAQEESGAATVLITHDMGVVAEMADEVAVMYAGRVVEVGTVEEIFDSPQHPYTARLLECTPSIERREALLPTMRGAPPDPLAEVSGCAFSPRCDWVAGPCREETPSLAGDDHRAVACHVLPFPSMSRAEVGA